MRHWDEPNWRPGRADLQGVTHMLTSGRMEAMATADIEPHCAPAPPPPADPALGTFHFQRLSPQQRERLAGDRE